jgi:hypothetical protein
MKHRAARLVQQEHFYWSKSEPAALSCVNSVHPLVATVTPFWRRDDSSQLLLSQVTHCTEQEEASDRQAE